MPELMRVGETSMRVAFIGVAAPFLLGFGAVHFLFPGFSFWLDIYIGATLCATSVGISARLLKDLGKIKSAEGSTILGAAIVDDVLGLVILAVVVALIVAVAGKLVSAGGILPKKGAPDRWAVALGMVPRGEVGLIFAGVGAKLQVGGAPLLDAPLYAAVIIMVFVTTALTPPLLMRRLRRMQRQMNRS